MNKNTVNKCNYVNNFLFSMTASNAAHRVSSFPSSIKTSNSTYRFHYVRKFPFSMNTSNTTYIFHYESNFSSSINTRTLYPLNQSSCGTISHELRLKLSDFMFKELFFFLFKKFSYGKKKCDFCNSTITGPEI